ncbi:MAG: helix-turn-helix transcriptional regulator [Bauldia sp.]|nr:helix-turn-helix transcriptional regulator [Bauldia sp.]
MLSHGKVWAAIDRLAAGYGLSASGLARKAGLDPTSFNPSKRVARDGRPRWPSTESIAKILAATGASFEEFLDLRAENAAASVLPLLGFARAGAGGFFGDGGAPAGSGWEEVAFPGAPEGTAYALRITGDSMLPVYRDGDTIVVAAGAACRPGDRVVVKTTGGEVMAKELRRRAADGVSLRSLNPAHPDRFVATADLDWIARILWASQ